MLYDVFGLSEQSACYHISVLRAKKTWVIGGDNVCSLLMRRSYRYGSETIRNCLNILKVLGKQRTNSGKDCVRHVQERTFTFGVPGRVNFFGTTLNFVIFLK